VLKVRGNKSLVFSQMHTEVSFGDLAFQHIWLKICFQEEKKKKPRSFSHQESKIWHTPDLVTRDYHVVEIFTVESRQIKGVLL